MSRETTSELVEIDATCHGCDWGSIATNALGNAARHHDATGHYVDVVVTRRVHYGSAPTAEDLGQLPLDRP